MADSQLRREVELAVAEMNEKPMSKEYSAELDTHADGPAIDVQVDGEATAIGAHRFFEAAHNAGYVVSNCKVFEEFDIGEPHTRLFLRDAADHIDVEPSLEDIREAAIEDAEQERAEEEAFAEGFAAAIFLLSLWEVMGLLEGGDEDLDALFDGVGEGDMDEWEEFF